MISDFLLIGMPNSCTENILTELWQEFLVSKLLYIIIVKKTILCVLNDFTDNEDDKYYTFKILEENI